MSDLVFFGAGASKPFGIPTMHEMVTKFEQDLKDDTNLHDFYHKIKDKLIKGYGASKTDIESILSVINGIVKNKKPIDLGHYVFYYISDGSNKQFSSDDIELAKKLQKKIRDYIKKECEIDNDLEKNTEICNQTYLPLFKHISDEKTDYAGEELAHKWKAYTTNYDNIFEDFWSNFKPPEDHFGNDIDSSANRYFTIKLLTKETTFCKLHGSLDWTKEVGKNRIVKKTHSKFERVKTEGEMMLFPIQQKDLYLHPWFTLFHDLKLGLAEKSNLYAIGYAFNDEFIKNAFQEALEHGPDKKLIIINPDAEQIRAKFPKPIRKQIEILPINFGGKFFELQFADHVKGVKTIVVRFDIKKSDKRKYRLLSIKSNHLIQTRTILNLQENKILSYTDPPLIIPAKHVDCEIPCLRDMEIKLQLQIIYTYGDEIELYISDSTKDLKFGIDYCLPNIASSDDIKHEYEERGAAQYTIEPIKLDTTKLYRR